MSKYWCTLKLSDAFWGLHMFKRLGLSNKKGLTRLIISFCQAEHYCTSEDNLTFRFANPRVLGLKNQNNDLHGKAKGK